MDRNKLLCILLTLALCLGLLAGCDTDQGSKPVENNQEGNAEQISAEAALADAASLRSVISEVYASTMADSNFVNTANDMEPMLLPSQYYSDVKSVCDDGELTVYMDSTGTVIAFFGEPVRTYDYYEELAEKAQGNGISSDNDLINASNDAASLRRVVSEVYVNTLSDPNFVNTATANQPMVIPSRYYTDAKSASGDGELLVTMNQNGEIAAYFGSPDKNVDYYSNLTE